MSVKNLTLKEAREKLGAKQDELGEVFAEAKTDDGGLDFNKVSCLGENVKGSIAVAEKVKAMNAELDELAAYAETLEAAEDAALKHAGREKARGGFRQPGVSKGNYPSAEARFKALGEMAFEQKAFKDWMEKGAPSGITFSIDDIWPTDMLAVAASFETIGAKALMATTAGYAPEVMRQPGFVDALTRPIQLLDIIPTFQTDQASVKYMEETTRTHAAAEVAEGGAYAESAFAFTEKDSPVRKIGDSLPVTDEQLEDVPMMQGYINTRLPFGVRQRLDGQILIGNGTAPNLRGLKNLVGIQTQAKATDPTIDAFYKAMTKIRLTGRSIPTHHLIHPLDWQNIRLTRTTDGVYIFGSPSEAGADRLWGLPVVQPDADAAGTGYTGSFRPDTVSLHEKRGVELQVGYVGTQFVEGKRTVRGDMRAALVWWRPPAFCSVTGI
ncbi:phage major capsid protein [Sphingobium lignivorans]|uniref:HK97 family phage major capsid protein n=1 Tax=Sphingobium lignivorans TaxID=2735886 RepID=A0ABR6NJG9_9SPHN|nr:phage major capsid protein [Sphingobium lignivorans]MBB5987424.1 HK97 family phage major capsid protein [Sphingobium lignivorans]